MTYRTLLNAVELEQHLADPDWAIIDCRFSFDDPELGRREYLHAHISGAVYADLDRDLSAPPIPGVTGRHPLPAVADLAETFSGWGIGPGVQVCAYDGWPSIGGATAARLWWCLRWLGHDAVAVLDGGWEQWRLISASVEGGDEVRQPKTFTPSVRPELLAGLEEVNSIRNDPAFRVFDSRAAERYRGDIEPLYPVAGHIPGAYNAPYAENTHPDGRFLSQDDLRTRFKALLGEIPVRQAVFYCGSGVTAAMNLLALEHAGLGWARLYNGSWSEWIVDPLRPVVRG